MRRLPPYVQRALRPGILVLVLVLVGGCFLREIRYLPVRPQRGTKPRSYNLIVTGYCKCKECCGWKRNWLGIPVYASGSLRGKRKWVGVTASGVHARTGTIAADTSIFPFGTVMKVPGYGYGVVEDRGGDIKGYHIDLYFLSHEAAKKWGRKKLRVDVWR